MSKTRWEAVLLIALVAPFVALGARDAWRGIGGLRDYARTGAWEPVSAALTDVQLLGPGEDKGDFAAAYTYRFGGREYSGRYVGFSAGFSSEVRRAWARYDTLREHFARGEPLQALVDPARPTESVLFREWDPQMLASLLAGLGFAIGALTLAALGARVFVAGLGLRAERPWRTRRDWVRGTAGAVQAAGWTTVMIGCILTSLLLLSPAATGSDAPTPVTALHWALLFLAAAWLLLTAVRLLGRRLAYGSAVLHLSEVPVVPGRSVEAVMVTRRPLKAGEWRLELRCMVPAGLHLQRTVREAVAWARENGPRPAKRPSLRGECIYSRRLSLDEGPRPASWGGTVLPVTLQVPADAPFTWPESGDFVRWELAVVARAKPWAFDVEFDLPVFPAEEAEIEQRPIEPGRPALATPP